MSNPLRWFRQNSQILVVFLGIGCMAIFGLGPVFDYLSQSSSYDDGGQDPVVASWKGGDLNRRDLDQLRRRHYDLLSFQQGVAQAAIAQKGDEYQPFVQPIRAIRDSNDTGQALIDDQLIDRLLLAEKAKEEGFVVSNAMVDQFLTLLAGEAEFSRADFERINNEANQRRCSLEQVRRQLKMELLYRQMNVMARSGMPMLPNPTESMELYGKVSNRIECEVVPVAVSQFIDEVTEEPSNAELRSLYNEGKFNYPDPSGERPGFKIGRQLVAQYMMADYDTFLQNEINKLSDAEVQAEYDRLVEAKDDLVMEVVPEEENTDDGADVVTPPAGADGDEEPAADGQSIRIRRSKARLVSYSAQDDEAPAVPETSEPAPATESADEPANVDEATAADDAPDSDVAETKTEETTETVGTDDVTDDQEDASETEDAADEDDSIGPLLTDAPKLEKRAKPLREVAEAIKRKLKSEDASKAIDAALVEASSAVSNFRGAYMNWKQSSENGGSEDIKPVFDYEGVAKNLNLTPNETPLVDDEQLEQEPLGKIMTLINVATRGGQYQPQAVPVANYIFNSFEKLDEFESQTVQDFQTRSRYVFWLSDKREPRIPSFDECRDDIITFWKQQQALKMAQAEATKLADAMAKKRDQKLSEVYPERTVKTGEFTWFSNYGRPAISAVVGVSRAGDDFMSTAFALDRLEAGTSINETRDTVYVIQRVSEDRPIEEIATDYMENQFFKFKAIPTQVRDTAAWYRRQMDLDWGQEFVDEMDLEVVSY